MRILSFFTISVVVVIVSAQLSCSPPNAPVDTHPFAPMDHFSYAVNGQVIGNSSNFIGCTGSALLSFSPQWQSLGVGKSLQIQFLTTQNFHIKTLYFSVIHPGLGSFSIFDYANAGDSVSVTYYSDTTQYYSRSGNLTITKYDTVNNLISGSFSMSLSQGMYTPLPSTAITISSGTFTDVPIYMGSYGQGNVSAFAEGSSFATQSSISSDLTAYITGGTAALNILAADSSSMGPRIITFMIITPKQGSVYNLQASQYFGMSNSASYYSSIDNVSFNTTNGGGQFTLTKFDSVTHRLSGIFNFSGIDANSGNTVMVTNGVIDNVEWFVL